jgi:hypothetical protein
MNPPPKIVYKYRDWKNDFHNRILLNNEIYLSSPNDFNDPFDCRVTENYNLFTPEEEKKYINELLISGFPKTEAQGLDFRMVVKGVEDLIKDKEKLQETIELERRYYQDHCYAIFSCSKIWNNILMWSHYANHHTGFCVGFYKDKLLNSGFFGKAGDVIYRTDFPEIKPRVAKKDDQLMINSFLETHSKARIWNYEKEFRFMTNHFPNELSSAERTVTIPDHYFSEVILGVNISEGDRNEIIEICNEKGLKVYQAFKVKFKFKIDRKPLN